MRLIRLRDFPIHTERDANIMRPEVLPCSLSQDGFRLVWSRAEIAQREAKVGFSRQTSISAGLAGLRALWIFSQPSS